MMPLPVKRDILRISSSDRGPTRLEILAAVAKVAQTSVSELQGQYRGNRICAARNVYYFIARNYTRASLPLIGKACGDRDHSTVASGIRRASDVPARHAPLIVAAKRELGL